MMFQCTTRHCSALECRLGKCSLPPFGLLHMSIQDLDVANFDDRRIREELLGGRPAISFPLPIDLPFLFLPAAVAWTVIHLP